MEAVEFKLGMAASAEAMVRLGRGLQGTSMNMERFHEASTAMLILQPTAVKKPNVGGCLTPAFLQLSSKKPRNIQLKQFLRLVPIQNVETLLQMAML